MHHIGEKTFRYGMMRITLLWRSWNGRWSHKPLKSKISSRYYSVICRRDYPNGPFEELKKFKVRAAEIVRTRPDLASLISNIEEANADGNYLFSIMRGFRLEHLLKRLLDENEFLSEYGILYLNTMRNTHLFSNMTVIIKFSMNPVRVVLTCLRELKLAWSYLDAIKLYDYSVFA
jgi:hypothetical protein